MTTGSKGRPPCCPYWGARLTQLLSLVSYSSLAACALT